jgi:hypothetical protein
VKPRRNRPPAPSFGPGGSSKRFLVTDEMAKDMANYVLGLNFNQLRGEDQRIIEEWLADKDSPAKRDRAWTVIEVLKYEHGRVPPKCRDVRFMSIGCRVG